MAELAAIGAAGTVTKTAVSCGNMIYGFFNGTTTVNGNIDALRKELEHVKANASAVEDVLNSSKLEAFQDAKLWDRAEGSLKACDDTLRRHLATIRKTTQRATIITQGKMVCCRLCTPVPFTDERGRYCKDS